MHPFHFLWNGIHMLLSPAASHSGWEDHMQSDQFHYLHHKKFECNYGSASFPLDNLFGTFRETLYGQSATYAGAGGDADKATKAAADTELKSTQAKAEAKRVKYPPMGKSPVGFHVYLTFTTALFALAFCGAYDGGSILGGSGLPPTLLLKLQEPWVFSSVVAFSPVVFAALLMRLVGDRSSMRWPFHKDAWSKQSLHVGVGFTLAVLPVYQTLMTLLAPPEQRIYCQLWGCSGLTELSAR